MMTGKTNRSEQNCRRSARFAAVITLGLLAGLFFEPLLAQGSSSAQNSDEWEVKIAPYLVIPWMNGKMTVRGNDLDIGAGPGAIIDNLQFGFMGYLEAQKGNWGFGVDLVYMALGVTIDRPPANVDPNEGAFTFMGKRKINQNLDFVFGARWNYLSAKVDLKEPIQRTLEQTKNWVDPIVGIHINKPLSKRWHFDLQGDIGGFGVGSDFTWNVFPVIGVNLSQRARVGFGYRALGIVKYRTGEGSERFEYDMIVSGPAIGASFQFQDETHVKAQTCQTSFGRVDGIQPGQTRLTCFSSWKRLNIETFSYSIGMAGTAAFAVTAVLALAPQGIDLFGACVRTVKK